MESQPYDLTPPSQPRVAEKHSWRLGEPLPSFIQIAPDDPDGDRKELEFTVAHELRKTSQQRYAELAELLEFVEGIRRVNEPPPARPPEVIKRA